MNTYAIGDSVYAKLGTLPVVGTVVAPGQGHGKVPGPLQRRAAGLVRRGRAHPLPAGVSPPVRKQKNRKGDMIMILVNTEYITGRELEMLGLVQGSTIQAKNIGRDITQALKSIVGGELESYTDMMNQARALATQRMTQQAEAMGADAIVAVRYALLHRDGGSRGDHRLRHRCEVPLSPRQSLCGPAEILCRATFRFPSWHTPGFPQNFTKTRWKAAAPPFTMEAEAHHASLHGKAGIPVWKRPMYWTPVSSFKPPPPWTPLRRTTSFSPSRSWKSWTP